MVDSPLGLDPEKARKELKELADLRLELIEEIKKYGKVGPDNIPQDYIELGQKLRYVEENIAAIRDAYSLHVLESLNQSSNNLNVSSLNLEASTAALLFFTVLLVFLTTVLIILDSRSLFGNLAVLGILDYYI